MSVFPLSEDDLVALGHGRGKAMDDVLDQLRKAWARSDGRLTREAMLASCDPADGCFILSDEQVEECRALHGKQVAEMDALAAKMGWGMHPRVREMKERADRAQEGQG